MSARGNGDLSPESFVLFLTLAMLLIAAVFVWLIRRGAA